MSLFSVVGVHDIGVEPGMFVSTGPVAVETNSFSIVPAVNPEPVNVFVPPTTIGAGIGSRQTARISTFVFRGVGVTARRSSHWQAIDKRPPTPRRRTGSWSSAGTLRAQIRVRGAHSDRRPGA